jgi:hypothetical protein
MPTYGLLENSSPARSREKRKLGGREGRREGTREGARECQSKPSKQKIQETWEKEV